MNTKHPTGECESARSDARAAALRVVDLKKRFDRIEVIKGVSLTAQRGDVISILGSSGSGKSTFLRCLNLLEQPNSGEIWLSGRPVKMPTGFAGRREISQLCQKLGMVFQNFNLWSHKTVLENIIEGPVHVRGIPRREACDQAEDLLMNVGLADKRHAYPSHLSGGQQQRIAIARALAMEPEILLFDEPTSALDPELVGEVLKVIRALADEGRTMIIVTHELGFARQVSSRVVFLHEGRIEEEGSADALFANPVSPRLRQFLSAQGAGGRP